MGFALLAVGLAGAGAWRVLAPHQDNSTQPYSKVEDGLYIGGSVGRPPPGTRAVVNLCGKPDAYAADAALWEPVLEAGKPADLAWLRRVVAFIAEQRRAGRPTYVHCMAGVNRSGAAMTGYLMQAHGWDRDVALRYLQQKRPEVQPDPGLLRLLAEWQKALPPQPPAASHRND